MSIDGLFVSRHRHRVAWFRAAPPDGADLSFIDRGFKVQMCTSEDLQDAKYLASLAAVIFTQVHTKLYEIVGAIRAHAGNLLNHDCRIIVRPAPPQRVSARERRGVYPISLITNVVNELKLPTAGLPLAEALKLDSWQSVDGVPALPHIRVYEESVPWNEIADFVGTYPPTRPPNLTLKIDGEKPTSSIVELLIKRAFADCTNVHLSSNGLDEGHSEVTVFRADAELTGGLLGRWPKPYFIKVGARAKVLAEYKRYQGQVAPYIPFHLGPHLDHERCCLGAQDGVIVGDFVEESESLASCAREGRAATPIACLFERTLKGWHRDAKNEQQSLTKVLTFPDPVPENRISRARQLGAERSQDELLDLFERCASFPTLIGAIHGDLHAANVRVRSAEAIVIDFLASAKGALIWDPASLEASLLVDGFKEDDPADAQAFLESVLGLYNADALTKIPGHPNPRERSSWFLSCARQIRMYALHMERHSGQYAMAVGVALLRKASKDSDREEPWESRRAIAYVLAERALMAASELTARTP